MADTGHLAIRGFKAAAIKYAVLRGFVPNPSGPPALNACLVTRGFGVANTHLRVLRGFVAHPTSAAGGFYIFGDSVIS